MSLRNKDVNEILKHFVKRQSKGEKKFIDDQKKGGIKVCEVISHQRSRDGKDTLVIETQLSSTNDSSDSSANRACSLLRVDNSVDQSGSSLTNSDYFIKEFKVSHVGKSKSLDEGQRNRTSNIHKTSLTTVVGKKDKPFETVYKAVIEHSERGRQLLQQESFVRDSHELPSSYHSLPGRITNSVSPTYESRGKNYSKKKSNKGRNWSSIFSVHKKSKKSKEELKDIDDLARQRVYEGLEVKVEAAAMTSPLSFDRELPFKSYKIGETLQSMKKKKKMPDFIRSMLSPTGSLPRTGFWSHKMKYYNSRIGSHHAKEFTTSDNIHKDGHATRLVTTLTQDSAEEAFYETNVSNGKDHIDHRSRNKSDSENISQFHFDMALPDKVYTEKITPDQACNCLERKLDLISRTLICLIHKTIHNDAVKDLESFDKTTLHFSDCPYNSPSIRRRKDSGDSNRRSRLSLYQSCEHCENADDQLHPAISTHLIPLINKLEDGDEINFNEDHLNFFLVAKCYKEFEEGMRQAIGFKCSVRNLAHLHYVTRKVVRHIGDPNQEDNEHIGRIMHFAEQFLADHFNCHIKEHGSVEDFLIHGSNYDID